MPNKSRIVRWTVVIGALLLFAWLISWLADISLFTPVYYRLYASFTTAEGLTTQSKVLMRGFAIGRVHHVDFEPSQILVALDIRKEYRIPSDSRCQVSVFSLLGERVIGILPGVSPHSASPGSRLASGQATADSASSWLLGQATVELVAIRDAIIRMAERFDRVSQDLSGWNASSLPASMAEATKAAERMARAAEGSSANIESLTHDTQAMLQKMDRTLDSLANAQARLERILDKLATPDNTAGELFSSRKHAELLEKTLEEVLAFIRELKKNPKKYLRMTMF